MPPRHVLGAGWPSGHAKHLAPPSTTAHTPRMRNHEFGRIILIVAALVPLSSVGPALAQHPAPAPDAATMRQMYGGGIDFDTFLAQAERRKQMWDANWEKSDPEQAFVERGLSLDGKYRLLAVAVDSCSDSVNTIPYIARLVAHVDQLDMQIVDETVGRLIMDTYRTPDDRGATPTVVILDETFEVVGAWIERPSALQSWWVGHPEISDREKARRKQGWYDWDEGYSTYAEIIGLLEAADSGR